MYVPSLRSAAAVLLALICWSGAACTAQAQFYPIYPRPTVPSVTVYVLPGVGPIRGVSYFVDGRLRSRQPQGTYRTYYHDGSGVRFRFHDGTYRADGSLRFARYRAFEGVHAFGETPRGSLYMYRDDPNYNRNNNNNLSTNYLFVR